MACSHLLSGPAPRARGVKPNPIATSNNRRNPPHGRSHVNETHYSTLRGDNGLSANQPPDDGSQRIGDGSPTEGHNLPSNRDLLDHGHCEDGEGPLILPQMILTHLAGQNLDPPMDTTYPTTRLRECPPINDYLKVATLNMRGRTSNTGGF